MTWQEYETEKRKIRITAASAEDYEQKIAKLVRRLKI